MRDQAERLRELVNSQKQKNQHHKARIIAVTSGKGGVGKTNLSVNLSICLSQMGQKVTLIDTDLGLANIDLMLGIIPQYHLGHVFSGEQELADVTMEGPAGVKIIAGGSGLQVLADLSSWQLDNCINRLVTLEEDNDFIIFDTGAGISNKVVRFLLAADEIIVVTIPEPTSIADAYGVIKIIAKENPDAKIYIAVNMVKNDEEGEQVVERLQMVAEKFLHFPLEPFGYIQYDSNVPKAVKQQQPFFTTHPNSKATQSIKQMAQQLLALPLPPSRGLKKFFQSLFSK
jgi:flagellar biosynthesis protein FlhG